MAENTPKTVYLADYAPPAYLIDNVELRFDLAQDAATVDAKLVVKRSPLREPGQPLVLDGQELELKSISIDGKPLRGDQYRVDEETLTIASVPDAFTLETRTRIKPQANTSLEGLYKSGDMFCTQCEAEGFRKITFYPDRPDVMSRFTTTIVADKGCCPSCLP